MLGFKVLALNPGHGQKFYNRTNRKTDKQTNRQTGSELESGPPTKNRSLRRLCIVTVNMFKKYLIVTVSSLNYTLYSINL